MLVEIVDNNRCTHKINPAFVVDILRDKGIELFKICLSNGFSIMVDEKTAMLVAKNVP